MASEQNANINYFDGVKQKVEEKKDGKWLKVEKQR